MNKQISFITAFKKFRYPYLNIQNSALYSWKFNDVQVVAPYCEIDTEEKCSKFDNIKIFKGARTARDLGFENQSPIIKDMIEGALPLIDTPMVALINSDIIINEDFSSKIDNILKKYGLNIFIVGCRRGITLKEPINSVESYKKIHEYSTSYYDNATSSDIFITSKFWWRKIIKEIPDFILGRYGWDNYLHLFVELNMRNFKYNCTDYLPILHCDHSYDHIILQEKKSKKHAPSSVHNLSLWEKFRSVYGTVKVNVWPKIE